MKRFLLAAAFFAVLALLWEIAYRAKIWSPVLLPSPGQVVNYLEGAAADGTLAKATVITMRRLLVGYLIGVIIGLPLGLLTARWKVFGDTDRNPCAWFTNITQCLLGASGALMVWPDRSSHAFCCGYGNSLVGDHRDRDRRTQCSADLSRAPH